MEDLAAVMRGRPDIVALPKVAAPAEVTALDEAVARFEREYGFGEGTTRLLPNIEFARGLAQTGAIAAPARRKGIHTFRRLRESGATDEREFRRKAL
jgi:citrate lyase subunit beta/citryl-CoA lyase